MTGALFALVFLVAQIVPLPAQPSSPATQGEAGLATLSPTLAPAKDLPTPRALTILPSPKLKLSASAAASLLATPSSPPILRSAPPPASGSELQTFLEFLFAFAIIGLAVALWMFARRIGVIARDVARSRDDAASLHRRALMPVCRLEDPSQAVLPAELSVGSGRGSVTQYRIAGRIVNSGSGPALNLGVMFMIRDKTAGYGEGGRVANGALPPLGPRDAYPFLLDVRTLIPWEDLARRNDWVIRIAYDDVFGQTFTTVYESRTSTITLEQPT